MPDHARVKALFFDALDQDPAVVGAWLRQQTVGDPALCAAVAELLDFHDDAPLLGEPAPPALPTDPLGLSGETLAGGYRVERFVAEGGFAFVYRAVGAAGPVAVKVFKEVDPDQRQHLERAFRREADVLEALAARVPTLVGIHGLTHWRAPSGHTLLVQVLEWLDGQPLPIDPAGATLGDVTRRLGPIAQALAAAHDAGVAHRDVKPDNVFLLPDGQVRLLDFGIAKVAHERARGFASTATAGSAFTLAYAAPEQLTGAPTGPWTDVYALAVVAVELLAGRHPGAGQGALETMMALADPARRPTPRAVGVAVSDAVEAAFATALAVDPAARPAMRDWWGALAALAAPGSGS